MVRLSYKLPDTLSCPTLENMPTIVCPIWF